MSRVKKFEIFFLLFFFFFFLLQTSDFLLCLRYVYQERKKNMKWRGKINNKINFSTKLEQKIFKSGPQVFRFLSPVAFKATTTKGSDDFEWIAELSPMADRAIKTDNSQYPSPISVGTPPSSLSSRHRHLRFCSLSHPTYYILLFLTLSFNIYLSLERKFSPKHIHAFLRIVTWAGYSLMSFY